MKDPGSASNCADAFGTLPRLMRWPTLALVALLLIAGCKKPEGGLKLVYSGAAGAKERVERRLRSLGVSGAVARAENGKLSVFLPGGRGAEGVKRTLRTPGVLEFSLVREGEVKPPETLPEGVVVETERAPSMLASSDSSHLRGAKRELVEAAAKTATFPEGRVLVSADQSSFRTWVVRPDPILTGDAVEKAEAKADPNIGGAVVMLTFDKAGGETFRKETGLNTGRRLAIIFDGTVVSAPVIMEEIPGGKAMLALGSKASLADAKDMAVAIEGHSLPTDLQLEAESPYAASEAPQ